MKAETIGVHPMLLGNQEETALASEKADFLEQMKNFRPANVTANYKFQLVNERTSTSSTFYLASFRQSLRRAIHRIAERCGR